MTSTITPNISFLYPSFEKNTQPQSNSTATDKTSNVVVKTLPDKSNSTWYTDAPTENESQLVPPTSSLHNATQNTLPILNPPPKKKPIPLPRSSTTSLSTTQNPPELASLQTKNPPGTGLLDAVLKAKSSLKKSESNNSDPLPKKIPPLLSPLENNPKRVVFTTPLPPDIIHNSLEYNPENSEVILESILKNPSQASNNIACEDPSSISKIENDLSFELEELNKILQVLDIAPVQTNTFKSK